VPGFTGWLTTGAGRVPQIATVLTGADRLGAWKARWGIGRMSYMVSPGLYAIGNPTPDDPVLVTANYKMSYDIIRSVLVGRNVWLLVLETYGINVWCAAGKGTFGTEELVRRIGLSGLTKVVAPAARGADPGRARGGGSRSDKTNRVQHPVRDHPGWGFAGIPGQRHGDSAGYARNYLCFP
jgi:hypothetical protein